MRFRANGNSSKWVLANGYRAKGIGANRIRQIGIGQGEIRASECGKMGFGQKRFGLLGGNHSNKPKSLKIFKKKSKHIKIF